MYIDLTIITLIIVYVWDISGFVPSVKRMILRKLTKADNPDDTKVHWPPFDCSKCMTLWTGLAYILATNSFSLVALGFVCLLSFMTIPIAGLMNYIYDLISWMISKLNKIIF
jgi:hypothetical protein